MLYRMTATRAAATNGHGGPGEACCAAAHKTIDRVPRCGRARVRPLIGGKILLDRSIAALRR
jgi:hypothetical protein